MKKKECLHCRKLVWKSRLCQRHWNMAVRKAILMIDETRKKDKGWQKFNVKTKVGIFSGW